MLALEQNQARITVTIIVSVVHSIGKYRYLEQQAEQKSKFISMLRQETIELKTILDFIRWSASRFNAENLFYGHGTNNAIDEAAALVLNSLHLSYDLPDRYLDAFITSQEREAILNLVYRRIEERKPVPYLTNEALFCGLSFYVDERTLVPRSPIAELIENSFIPWCGDENVDRILDIGTGSACIAIAIAYQFPNAQIDAVDTSQDALTVAKINVEKHEMKDRVQLIQSDLFSELDFHHYDLIVSNPPYVSDSEWRGLPDEYISEPKIGFHGGETGLDIVQRILCQAEHYLSEKGILVVEVGRSAELLQQTYPDVSFLWLDFEHGGDGVFLLTKEQLTEYRPYFQTKHH